MKRSLLKDWLIDGYPILSPDEGIEINETDIEDEGSGKDASGYYHPIILRYGVRSFVLPYSVLTAEEYAYMRNLVGGKATVEVTSPDGKFTARCHKRSVVWKSSVTGLYNNYNLEFLEC